MTMTLTTRRETARHEDSFRPTGLVSLSLES